MIVDTAVEYIIIYMAVAEATLNNRIVRILKNVLPFIKVLD